MTTRIMAGYSPTLEEYDLPEPPEHGPAILIYDIETAPALAWVWSQYETNVIATEQDWYMLCFVFKWWGQRKKHFVSIVDDPNFHSDSSDDYGVAAALNALFDRADVTVAHNGDRFDKRKANARFLYHGLAPPSPYQTVDTRKQAAKHFSNYSNSLDELGRLLRIGQKKKHEGFALWRACMRGEQAAWNKMKRYNFQDVTLLERLYVKLLPWIDNHINLGFWHPGETVCRNCGSKKLTRRGYQYTTVSQFVRFQCNRCGKYGRARYREKQTKETGVQVV